MNTYYKAAKLTTGELLAFTTEQEITSRQLNELRYIDIQNPVAFYSFRFLEDGKLNEVVGMQPWVPITHDEHYPLAVQSIVTIADLDARASVATVIQNKLRWITQRKKNLRRNY